MDPRVIAWVTVRRERGDVMARLIWAFDGYEDIRSTTSNGDHVPNTAVPPSSFTCAPFDKSGVDNRATLIVRMRQTLDACGGTMSNRMTGAFLSRGSRARQYDRDEMGQRSSCWVASLRRMHALDFDHG